MVMVGGWWLAVRQASSDACHLQLPFPAKRRRRRRANCKTKIKIKKKNEISRVG